MESRSGGFFEWVAEKPRVARIYFWFVFWAMFIRHAFRLRKSVRRYGNGEQPLIPETGSARADVVETIDRYYNGYKEGLFIAKALLLFLAIDGDPLRYGKEVARVVESTSGKLSLSNSAIRALMVRFYRGLEGTSRCTPVERTKIRQIMDRLAASE